MQECLFISKIGDGFVREVLIMEESINLFSGPPIPTPRK
jgi:hypothetical protein